MAAIISTIDHSECDCAAIELGLQFKVAGRDLRGPALLVLLALGLAMQEACSAARLSHLELVRSF